MDTNEKLKLVVKNSQEVIDEKELRKLLENKKNPVAYLGTAITGKPHIGYLSWVTKLSQLVKAGFKVKVLLADLHGALDNCPWELLEKRYKYYEILIPAMFKALNVDLNKIEVVRGSSFQTSSDYVFDMYKMSTVASVNDCSRATSDIVKKEKSPKTSGLIYAMMQALDEEYLNVDMQVGGNDQRKALVFAREFLPKINKKKRVELLLPLIPAFNQSGKMSSSDQNSKIELTEDFESIKAKMKKAYCPEGEIEGNGVLGFLKIVLFEYLNENNLTFKIERPEKWGGNLEYNNYKDFEKDFVEKKVHPLDVKISFAKYIDQILEVVRNEFKGKEHIIKDAY